VTFSKNVKYAQKVVSAPKKGTCNFFFVARYAIPVARDANPEARAGGNLSGMYCAFDSHSKTALEYDLVRYVTASQVKSISLSLGLSLSLVPLLNCSASPSVRQSACHPLRQSLYMCCP